MSSRYWWVLWFDSLLRLNEMVFVGRGDGTERIYEGWLIASRQ
ncbi:hypothetical protein JCM19235_863 [Vibrio maritimus]|uniref:Uncharacterized protein n=1 Tax=Vibrio maritimus TaxID=990268 RepID=A0A090SJB9_9VIBR|nr:hypothetical protein JCM19235_863 [Vibrio maritimus]